MTTNLTKWALLGSACALMLAVSPIEAATVRVTSEQDPAIPTPGTLRYEIANASSGDQIVFDASVQLISLAQGAIIIDKDLSLSGNAVLSGNDTSQVFYVTNKATVSLDGLTLTHGYCKLQPPPTLKKKNSIMPPPLGLGGALYGDYETFLALKNCIFSKNKAQVWGGAFCNVAGGATVENCLFIENQANEGGAIYADSLTVTSSHFVANHSRGDGGGGAIKVFNSSMLTIESSSFCSNSSKKTFGGAIAAWLGENIVINNSQFVANSAKEDGGAIWAKERSALTLTNSTFIENTAGASAHGGAIYTSKVDQLQVDNCSIQLNVPDNVFP